MTIPWLQIQGHWSLPEVYSFHFKNLYILMYMLLLYILIYL